MEATAIMLVHQIILTTNKNHRGRPTTETEWKQEQSLRFEETIILEISV